MGSIMGKAMDENLKKNQAFMLEMQTMTVCTVLHHCHFFVYFVLAIIAVKVLERWIIVFKKLLL